MIVQLYLTVLILILRSVVHGDFLDADNAQTCTELCANCNGTAIFEAGRCECYFANDNKKEADYTELVKRQTKDLALDLATDDLVTVKRPVRCFLGSHRQFGADDVERVAKYFMEGGALASPFFPERHPQGSSSNQMTGASDPMTGEPSQMSGSCNPLTSASDMYSTIGKLKSILHNPHNSMTGTPNFPRNNPLKAMSDQIAGGSYNPSTMTGTQNTFPTAGTSQANPVSSTLPAQGSLLDPMSGAAYPLMYSPMGEMPGMQQFINSYPMTVSDGIVGGQQSPDGLGSIPYAMNMNNINAVHKNTIDEMPQHMIGNAPMVESMGSPCVGSSPSFGNDNAMGPSYPSQYQHMIGDAPMVESMGSPCVGSSPSFGNDNAMGPSYPNQYQGSGQFYPMLPHYINQNPYLRTSNPQTGGFAPRPDLRNIYPQLEIPSCMDTAHHSSESSYCSLHSKPFGASKPNVPPNVGMSNNAMSGQDDSTNDSNEAKELEKLVKSEKKSRRKPMKDSKLGAKKKFRDSKAEAPKLNSTEILNKNEKEDIN